jgi:hypothetical protein
MIGNFFDDNKYGYLKKPDTRIRLSQTFKIRDRIELEVLSPDRKSLQPKWAGPNKAG